MTIDAPTIGSALTERRWRLAFPPEMEARFELETGDARCRRVILHNYMGLAIYNAFLLGDWLLIRDVFKASLCLHLLVMTPIMGLVIAIIARRPRPWLRESILAGGIVLGVAAILGLMLLSRSPLRTSEHISVVLVILFATMVQRIRFPYVAFAVLASFFLYASTLGFFARYDPARVCVEIAVFAGVVLFSLVGCYNLEREQRTSYLLALRDRLRNEDLEAVSRRDALTGLGNRRALDHALARLQNHVADTPIAVLIFDVDSFKAYNDNNGHLAGDACLQQIAAVIGGDARLGRDRVFRFGGEEFLALVENCPADDAHAIGEDIRAAVEKAAIPHRQLRNGVVTISVGVEAASGGAELLDAIANADRALYVAKHAGRNQVRLLKKTMPELGPKQLVA